MRELIYAERKELLERKIWKIQERDKINDEVRSPRRSPGIGLRGQLLGSGLDNNDNNNNDGDY